MAAEPEFTAEQVDAAVQALNDDPDRFAHATQIVTHAAPGLQRVLNEALAQGGWLTAHEAEVTRAAGTADEGERLAAVRTLLAEETRLAMLVGAAVGLQLGQELRKQREGEP